MTDLGKRIKELRKAKNITQEQLAEYLEVSSQAVSRWETGLTCPDISNLPRLAELFSITVDELLGVNEEKKRREINEVISDCEAEIDRNITENAIHKLRTALTKYPGNDRLLCCLMYALYVACEDEEFCRNHDDEIFSIAHRIGEYSTDDDCRNEARRLLFRHCCDTGRKAEALKIADEMAHIETSLQRNIYWALDGNDRVSYLREKVLDDLRELVWDIWAYTTHANLTEEEKAELTALYERIDSEVKAKFE